MTDTRLDNKERLSWQSKCERVSDLFAKAYEGNILPQVLEDILTPQEIETLYERIHLLESLLAGKTQRDVSQELGISVTTVNRGARILKYGTGKVRDIL